MTYEVILTSQALQQLQETVSYISKTLIEPKTALKWLNTMESEIRSLEYMPNRFQLTPEEPWHTKGIHRMIVMNYHVYYWINEEDKKVWITAIIYGRRNQAEQLKQMNIL